MFIDGCIRNLTVLFPLYYWYVSCHFLGLVSSKQLFNHHHKSIINLKKHASHKEIILDLVVQFQLKLWKLVLLLVIHFLVEEILLLNIGLLFFVLMLIYISSPFWWGRIYMIGDFFLSVRNIRWNDMGTNRRYNSKSMFFHFVFASFQMIFIELSLCLIYTYIFFGSGAR